MSDAVVTLTVTDHIAHIALAQAERGNPLDARFCSDLSRIAASCDEDQDVRAVLITSSGRYFSVGGDLASLGRDRDALPAFLKSATADFHSAISRLARMDAPVVVAVHALAVGGAVSLAAAADFCLAARSASFYAGYTGIGLSCDGGATTFLPRRVGVRRTAEFLMRNQTWTAEQGARFGLISQVVEDAHLPAAAGELAAELATGPTRAFGELKNLLLSSGEQPLESQLECEARAIARTARTQDAWQGISAAAAKLAPTFVGR
jgi:2-(1,2-epoxy-1,2-dihydrophenyl)acetyl-CoA isomerase